MEITSEQLEETMHAVLSKMFAAEDAEGNNRFINVGRVPLICQSILGINKRLESIESNMTWGVRIVIGAVILALLTLVLKQ